MPILDSRAAAPRPEHSSPRDPGNHTGPADPERIAAAIRLALVARGPGRCLCPSEVARALADAEPAWRALMPAVRAVAARMAEAGELIATRRGRPVPADRPGGPIRLALPVDRALVRR